MAAELGLSRDMVSKWLSRFLRDRLEGLTDELRPGRPRSIGDEQVEAVITATLEQVPGGRGHALVHPVDGQVAGHGLFPSE